MEQACKAFTLSKDWAGLARTLLELGQLYGQMRDFELADICLKDALRLFRRLQDKERAAMALEALGNLALQTARFPKGYLISEGCLGSS
ncbi:MAG: hypothetical protein Q9O62_11175 [Ardenticatenia bacterium]|nr:hypothetical protein [Ardenticatenia bacterium]